MSEGAGPRVTGARLSGRERRGLHPGDNPPGKARSLEFTGRAPSAPPRPPPAAGNCSLALAQSRRRAGEVSEYRPEEAAGACRSPRARALPETSFFASLDGSVFGGRLALCTSQGGEGLSLSERHPKRGFHLRVLTWARRSR